MTASSQNTCPAREVLDDFRLGHLPDSALEQVAEHIAGCESCSTELAQSSAEDALMVWLRRSLRQAPSPEEEASVAIALKARELGGSNGGLITDTHAGESARFKIPQFLGPYEILEPLNGGGMGDIYKARHTRLKRLVALKTLTPDRAGDEAAIARFKREMEAGGAVPDHPHLIRCTDANEERGVHFLVMDFIPGTDLARLVAARGPLEVADACELVRQAALGLAHLHAHGLVHRDVKPSNLILSAEGKVKVLDLGLAKLPDGTHHDDRLTGVWTLMGTADYMAPEQIFDAHRATPAADVYSLGCTLYKLLTGRAPFEDAGERTVKLRAHSMQTPPDLRDVRPDAPGELAALNAQLLSKLPEDRGGARDLAAALAPLAVGNSILGLVEHVAAPSGSDSTQPRLAATTASRFARTQGRTRRRRTLAVGAAILFVFGIAAFLSLRGRHDAPVEPDGEPEPVSGRYYSALHSKPKELLWSNFNNSHYTLEPNSERLTVVNNGPSCVLGVGKMKWPAFRLEVEIQQGPWVGNVGIVFGYRERSEAGKPREFEYQALLLEPTPEKGHPDFAYRLVRRAFRGTNNNPVVTQIGPPVFVPRPEFRPIEMSIVCDADFGLRRATWDHRDLAPLYSKQANASLQPSDYLGEFGVYQLSGTTQYVKYQYYLYEARR